MARANVLVEILEPTHEPFALFAAASASQNEAIQQSESILSRLGGMGLEIASEAKPIPLFDEEQPEGLTTLSTLGVSSEVTASSQVVACEVDSSKLEQLAATPKVRVWPNSTMSVITPWGRASESCPHCSDLVHEELDEASFHPFDLAPTASSRIDCRPFRPAATIPQLRELLAVARIWNDGFRGQNIVVGIVDEGVNGFYPVIGGHERMNAPRPGSAAIGSHGSMCAADVLVAAPFTRILDYPFLAGPNAGSSSVAIEMFQAILEQRRLNGTPHLTSNSYGFYALPSKAEMPNHEAYDRDHPLNRKVREVIASGCPCFFAAGNCGSECPAGNCHSSAIGPNRSISGANSLLESWTIAAVNSRHERIGYSAQGPGTLHPAKPDLSAYSHFFGNFGPGRPAGGTGFDNGTSAACPVAAGVAALLLSAIPGLSPQRLWEALVQTAINLNQPGWDDATGFGVINAGAAYNFLRGTPPPPPPPPPAPAPVRRPPPRRRRG